ncbi:MAG: endolytic transglycosylase MltG [Patescibacteria group bacterium]
MKLSIVLIRGLYVLVLVFCVLATAGISALLESKKVAFNQIIEQKPITEVSTDPFPVSVDPLNQTITKEDLLNDQVAETLAISDAKPDTLSEKIIAFFYRKAWYQNLASSVSRVIVIWPGERREEIAKYTGEVLRWNEDQQAEFTNLVSSHEPALSEGKFYPGQYVAHRGATPTEVAALINEKFEADVLSRYTPEVAAKVPFEDALIIASLLEREASDFENMREISGVIWNRLFIDMPLQLDATLQYAKANTARERSWWPTPKPADKYLKSPYNTYANPGLPPGPIANPSAAAVLAALNPRSTDCLFYFHDRDEIYHCSTTYQEHVRKLKLHYGRGR